MYFQSFSIRNILLFCWVVLSFAFKCADGSQSHNSPITPTQFRFDFVPFQFNDNPLDPYKQQRLIYTFSRLRNEQLPLLPALSLNYYDPQTMTRQIIKLTSAPNYFLKLFPSPNYASVNYILDGQGCHETFTQSKPRRSAPREDHPIMRTLLYTFRDVTGTLRSMGKSHGIDDADQEDNSNAERKNYTPANWFYNERIRNHHVRYIIRKEGGQYKEIAIYSPLPILTDDRTPVPEGFLFLEYVNGWSKAYYFPNFIDYSRIFPHRKPYYKDFLNLFRINEQESPILQWLLPIIYIPGIQKDIFTNQAQQKFDIGMNILAQEEALLSSRYFQFPLGAKHALRRFTALHLTEEAATASLAAGGIEMPLQVMDLRRDPRTFRSIGGSLYDLPQAQLWFKSIDSQIEANKKAEQFLHFLTYLSEPDFEFADEEKEKHYSRKTRQLLDNEENSVVEIQDGLWVSENSLNQDPDINHLFSIMHHIAYAWVKYAYGYDEQVDAWIDSFLQEIEEKAQLRYTYDCAGLEPDEELAINVPSFHYDRQSQAEDDA
ncbi:MAG: hypothetical protein BGO76_00885 [Caedibacter sp. 38-128]|nr:hypothetical protein [Holosporales bacterium]OJX06452.1 MAG: hypothetical protein BGO76_00885 [Caedibacter sp. 38-128]